MGVQYRITNHRFQRLQQHSFCNAIRIPTTETTLVLQIESARIAPVLSAYLLEQILFWLPRRGISPWSDVTPERGANRLATSTSPHNPISSTTITQSSANESNGFFIPPLIEPSNRDCSQRTVTATGSYSRYELPVSVSLCDLKIGRCGDLKLEPHLFLGMRKTASNNVASNLNMPALSPTMTEGTISSWKVKEGSFHPTTIHLGGIRKLFTFIEMRKRKKGRNTCGML